MGFELTRNYRESYGIFATNGILFNHESPRRGIEFVTRKITDGAARIKAAGGGQLYLGNLDAKRDWGHAKDYMEAAYLMLQQADPDDFVIATGETHSIRELLDIAFGHLDLDWKKHVVIDEKFIRPAEVDLLLGDSMKARNKLGWEPQYTFEGLIKEMVDADLERAKWAEASTS
jgi:GDPmannose 4,6-dehydratase